MPHLPHDVGEKDEQRDRCREERAGRADRGATSRGEDERDGEAGPEPKHARLVQETETEHDSKGEPSRARLIVEGAHDAKCCDRPEEVVERVDRIEVIRPDQRGGRENGKTREPRRKGPSAKRDREPARHVDERGARERRDEADRSGRVAEDGPPRRKDRDRERRMVHIAEREVVRARQVIELVAKVAVRRQHDDVKEELGRGKREDDPRGGVHRRRAKNHAPTIMEKRSHVRGPPTPESELLPARNVVSTKPSRR